MIQKAPNCLKCKYFFVTYDQKAPRGCKLFEVKSRLLPSQVVFKSSGSHCPSFCPRPPKK